MNIGGQTISEILLLRSPAINQIIKISIQTKYGSIHLAPMTGHRYLMEYSQPGIT